MRESSNFLKMLGFFLLLTGCTFYSRPPGFEENIVFPEKNHLKLGKSKKLKFAFESSMNKGEDPAPLLFLRKVIERAFIEDGVVLDDKATKSLNLFVLDYILMYSGSHCTVGLEIDAEFSFKGKNTKKKFHHYDMFWGCYGGMGVPAKTRLVIQKVVRDIAVWINSFAKKSTSSPQRSRPVTVWP